jgi:hypothetical protein
MHLHQHGQMRGLGSRPAGRLRVRSGKFRKFPTLKIALSEGSIGWMTAVRCCWRSCRHAA